MADQLLNFFTDEVVLGLAAEMAVQKNALIQSGAVVLDSALQSRMAGAARGDVVTMPWNSSLDFTVEPNAMTAEDDNPATPQTLSGTSSKARAYYHHQSWVIASMLEALSASSSPRNVLSAQLATYRMTWDQKYLLAMLQGIIADNIANDGGDMVNVIYSDIASPLAANLPSRSAINWAMQTMGDMRNDLAMIVAHSLTTANLQDTDPDGFKTDVQQVLGLPPVTRYRGVLYIEDDACTVVPGANSAAYYTYLLGPGAIAYAPVPLPTDSPESELYRNPLVGQGGGSTVHNYRWANCMNMYGISNLIPGGSGGTPLRMSNLVLAASWNREVSNRKLIPMACLIHNNLEG